MSVIQFQPKDGSEQFVCADCDKLVLAAVPGLRYEHPDKVCLSCSFIRNNPNLSAQTKALLRQP